MSNDNFHHQWALADSSRQAFSTLAQEQRSQLQSGILRKSGFTSTGHLERVKGIEPSYAAWEAAVLPLNYTRVAREFKRSCRSWAFAPGVVRQVRGWTCSGLLLAMSAHGLAVRLQGVP